jgi:hypothetical protein
MRLELWLPAGKGTSLQGHEVNLDRLWYRPDNASINTTLESPFHSRLMNDKEVPMY